MKLSQMLSTLPKSFGSLQMEIRKMARTVPKNTQNGNGGQPLLFLVYFCLFSSYVYASAYSNVVHCTVLRTFRNMKL